MKVRPGIQECSSTDQTEVRTAYLVDALGLLLGVCLIHQLEHITKVYTQNLSTSHFLIITEGDQSLV